MLSINANLFTAIPECGEAYANSLNASATPSILASYPDPSCLRLCQRFDQWLWGCLNSLADVLKKEY